MGIEQELSSRVEGQVRHLAQDGHTTRIRRGIGGRRAVDQQIELHVPAFDQREYVLELGDVVGRVAGRDIDLHRDLEQAQPGLVERLEPLGNVVQPDMTNAVIAQLLEHLGLLLHVALLGVVPVNAEREEGIGLCARGLGANCRCQQGRAEKQSEAQ